MQVLISLVAILQEIEATQRPIQARVQTRHSIPEPHNYQKQAQKIAKLSKLDELLLLEEAHILLEHRIGDRGD